MTKMAAVLLLCGILASTAAMPFHHHGPHQHGPLDWNHHPSGHHHHHSHHRSWHNHPSEHNYPFPGDHFYPHGDPDAHDHEGDNPCDESGQWYPVGHPLHNHPPGHPWHRPHLCKPKPEIDPVTPPPSFPLVPVHTTTKPEITTTTQPTSTSRMIEESTTQKILETTTQFYYIPVVPDPEATPDDDQIKQTVDLDIWSGPINNEDDNEDETETNNTGWKENINIDFGASDQKIDSEDQESQDSNNNEDIDDMQKTIFDIYGIPGNKDVVILVPGTDTDKNQKGKMDTVDSSTQIYINGLDLPDPIVQYTSKEYQEENTDASVSNHNKQNEKSLEETQNKSFPDKTDVNRDEDVNNLLQTQATDILDSVKLEFDGTQIQDSTKQISSEKRDVSTVEVDLTRQINSGIYNPDFGDPLGMTAGINHSPEELKAIRDEINQSIQKGLVTYYLNNIKKPGDDTSSEKTTDKNCQEDIGDPYAIDIRFIPKPNCGNKDAESIGNHEEVGPIKSDLRFGAKKV